MDKHHEDQNSMFNAANQFFKEKMAQLNSVPALGKKIGKFTDVTGNIEAKANEFNMATSGKVKEKEDAADAMLESTFHIKSALKSLAGDAGDQATRDVASVKEWKIATMRDNDKKAYSTSIYTLALAKGTALAEYGVEDGELPLFKTRIETFGTKMAIREESAAKRTKAKKALYALFTQANLLLDDIADLMKKFRTTDPELYNEFLLASTVKARGVRHKPKDASQDGTTPQPPQQ